MNLHSRRSTAGISGAFGDRSLKHQDSVWGVPALPNFSVKVRKSHGGGYTLLMWCNDNVSRKAANWGVDYEKDQYIFFVA